MLYPTDSINAFVIVQYIIVEIDGFTFKPSPEFTKEYFDQEAEAYTAIADRGKTSVRYCVLPSTTIFRQPIPESQYSDYAYS